MKLIQYFKSLIKPPIKSVALVLSGGGARGAIHLGVLHAFDENNIKIEAISGSSIGAIIGALYCAGTTPMEMKNLMESKKFSSLFNLSWSKRGLLTMNKLKKTLNSFIPINEFKSLKIPFYCSASNFDNGTYEILNKGDLITAVAASASIPILFEPVEINGQHYVDGGILNNLPIEPLLNKYKNIVGIHINNYAPLRASNFRTVAERIFNMVSIQNVRPKLKQCDYVIEPYMKKFYPGLDFRHTEELFEIGYKEGLEFIKKYC